MISIMITTMIIIIIIITTMIMDMAIEIMGDIEKLPTFFLPTWQKNL